MNGGFPQPARAGLMQTLSIAGFLSQLCRPPAGLSPQFLWINLCATLLAMHESAKCTLRDLFAYFLIIV